MVAHINTITFNGLEVVDVDVQVHMSSGIPAFNIVGLPDKTIAESKERVRAAINSIGLSLPPKRITINLAPADLFKEGSHFDLPIAVAILVAMEILPAEDLFNYIIMGELGLDGAISKVAGVLPAAMGAIERDKGIICPESNGAEALWSGIDAIIAAPHLIALINHFKGDQSISKPEMSELPDNKDYPNLADIKGQEQAKRALIITAAGGHNMLMSGPPGSGKSMLALRLTGILPKMTSKEILETSTVRSIAGQLEDGKLEIKRPFRAPHHSCSMPAMVGGGIGKRISPGEISLAHNGVLFLDELPEFPRQVLDALRQPIERKEILISRANAHITYPAKFQLIAAMNPCKCGYLDDASRMCTKAPRCAGDYQAKISGPILDRFDLYIDVPAIKVSDLTRNNEKDPRYESIRIRDLVEEVRNKQLERYAGYGITTNSELDGDLLNEYAYPDEEGRALLLEVLEKMKISMRGYNRILRVARTIADLENSNKITKLHLAEAVSYRIMNYGANNIFANA